MSGDGERVLLKLAYIHSDDLHVKKLLLFLLIICIKNRN